jgi:hypothetical protein
MKTFLLFSVLLLTALSAEAQQLFRMEIDANQRMETQHGAPGLLFDVPGHDGTVMIGGQFDTEGLGRHLIFNGGRLLIDNMVVGEGGYRYVTLRREDGRDFYDMFPVLRAKLIPLVELVMEEEEAEQ